MKKFLFAALAAAFIAAPASFAQTSNACANAPSITATSTRGAAKAQPKDMMKPFEGLNLSAAQRQSIEKINDEVKQQRQAQAKERQAQKEQRRAQKEQDKAAKQQLKSKEQKARVESRNAYLAKIKKVLTPEQYVQFLEKNYAEHGSKHKGGFDKGRKGPKGGEGKGRHHSNRGPKQNGPKQPRNGDKQANS